MGLSRWIQERDLKKDLKIIEGFDVQAKAELKDAVNNAMSLIRIRLGIPVSDILESTNFHVVANKDWGEAPLIINTRLRVPLMEQMNAGDPSAFLMYFGVSVVLHSVRAIMDYELNQNKRCMFWCQRLWYEFSSGDIENIPSRFRGDA